MSSIIILYYAFSKLSSDHHQVTVADNAKNLYVRAERVGGSLTDYVATPRTGEQFLAVIDGNQ